MDNKYEVALKEYNYDTNQVDELGSVSINTVAKNLDEAQLAKLLADYLNRGGSGFVAGQRVGKEVTNDHRTLQGLIINFCLGLIIGFFDNTDFADDRNRTAYDTAAKIKKLIMDGQLKPQPFI